MQDTSLVLLLGLGAVLVFVSVLVLVLALASALLSLPGVVLVIDIGTSIRIGTRGCTGSVSTVGTEYSYPTSVRVGALSFVLVQMPVLAIEVIFVWDLALVLAMPPATV